MTSGHTGSCGRWRTRSRAARPRSSRTSSPSACSVCHGCADRGPSLNFDFTDDQKAIKRTAHDFLAARYTSETIRELARDDRGFTDAQWQALVELGWPGVIVPEEHDGLGLGAVELIVIAEEMGYGLAPSPLQSNTCAALLLIAAENVGVAQRAMEMAVAYAGERTDGTTRTGRSDRARSLCGVEPSSTPLIKPSPREPTTMTRASRSAASSTRPWAGSRSTTTASTSSCASAATDSASVSRCCASSRSAA